MQSATIIKNFLCLIFSMMSFCVGAQKLLITDSTIIVGVVNSATYAEGDGLNPGRTIKEGSRVVIGGAFLKSSWTYIIYYREKKYYINSRSVQTKYENLISELKKTPYTELLLLDSNARKVAPAAAVYEKQEALKVIDRLRSKGLALIYSSVYDESEYTNGTGFEIKALNLSKKTIKYLTFNFTGINAVGDPVSTQTRKGIGPIPPDETGSYKFEYVWFTDIVQRSRMNSITIQYMDNSKKILTKSDISLIPSWATDLIFEE